MQLSLPSLFDHVWYGQPISGIFWDDRHHWQHLDIHLPCFHIVGLLLFFLNLGNDFPFHFLKFH